MHCPPPNWDGTGRRLVELACRTFSIMFRLSGKGLQSRVEQTTSSTRKTAMAWHGEYDALLPSEGGYTSGEDDNASLLSISDDESLVEDELDEDDSNFPRRQTESVIATIRLAEEVDELRRRRFELQSLQLARLLNSDRRDQLLTTALEYFDAFRLGLHSTHLPDIMRFLNSRIDDDLFSYGASQRHGTNTLIEQWQRYTRMLPSISIRMRSTSCTFLVDPRDREHLQASESDPTLTTCLVEAHGTLNGVISKCAVRTILPHIKHRHDLTHKLLDQQLNCPISLRFYFNSRDRVTRLDLHADFFRAFGAVPGVGLIDLVQIMDHARIGENSILPEVVEVEDDHAGEGDESKCPG